MSTSSVVFPNVQVCKENEKEMAAYNCTILFERNENASILQNEQFVVQEINEDMKHGNIPELQSIILAPSQNLKGNENSLDIILENKTVSDG